MPRRRRPPSPFDDFFDKLIDTVVERAESIITPAMEEISDRVAEMVEDQVRLQGQTPQGQGSRPRPRRPTGPGTLICTLCGKRPKDCRCRRGGSDTPPPPKTPHSPSVSRESTLYDDLEVSPKASQETIRAAYLSLSKRFHPDVAPGPLSLKRMQNISAAYNVLQDPVKRKQYDRRMGL